ncbi:MAG TPA: ATP-dependent metallopeptidase FtsH/Yme1/Tma family protein, partial [Arenibacter sp.]|nr:ATP-dependent metallopeptidase FtsH/Yme1/Tma family protein [Arenibacter sp.]
MAKENNTNPKKPKFNSWWIYGIIAVMLIGFQFFGSGNFAHTKKASTSELQEYLRNGDIKKILV